MKFGRLVKVVSPAPEGVEHSLPVIRRGRLEVVERRLTLCLAQAGIEERLGEAGRDAPDKALRIEKMSEVARRLKIGRSTLYRKLDEAAADDSASDGSSEAN